MMEEAQAVSALHALATRRFDTSDFQAAMSVVSELAVELSGATGASILDIDPQTSTLRVVAQHGRPIPLPKADVLQVDRDVVARALRSGTTVVLEDLWSDARAVGDALKARLLHAGIRAMLSTPLLTRSGQPVGVACVYFRRPHRPDERVLRWLEILGRQAADIVENVRVTCASGAREARLRALSLATSGIVFSAPPDWSQVTFYKKDGKDGRAVHEHQHGEDWLSQFVDPSDRPRVIEAIRDAAARPDVIDIVHGARDAEGAVSWRRSRAVPILDAEGRVHEWFGASSDLTEIKQALERLVDEQQRLCALLDALPVGVAFASSVDCAHVSGNRTLLRQLGASDADNLSASATDIEAFGRGLTYMQHGHPIEASELPLQRAAREGRDIEATELDVKLPCGKAIALEICAAPIRNSHGDLVGAVTVSTDISDRKLVREAQQELRSRDEFLAIMGHELRNPLAAISTAVDLVGQGCATSQRQISDKVIKDQVMVLKRLVSDLLDASRITGGAMQLHKDAVSLADLLAVVSNAAAPMAATRSQRLIVDFPKADVGFIGDKVRLQQILSNLVDNACKYSDPGGVVRLSGRVEGPDVVLRCSDTGHGIPAEVQQQIFEPLVRLESARQAEPGGLGLGLSLVRYLAQLHGGSVSVRSSGEGQGSEFSVRIPLEVPAPESPARRVRASDGVASAGVDRPRRSVVIVEDNPDVAQVLAIAMERDGHTVTRFAEGRAALKELDAVAPDVVLIDVGLPGIDGFDLAARLRRSSHRPDRVYIGMSGHPLSDTPPSRAQLFDHFISKPIDIRRLLDIVRSAPPSRPIRTLLVDDHAALAAATAQLLRSNGLDVTVCSSAGEAIEVATRLRPEVLLCDMALPDMDGLALVERLRPQLRDWGTYVAIVSARSAGELRLYRRFAAAQCVDQFVSKPLTDPWVKDLLGRLADRRSSVADHPDR